MYGVVEIKGHQYKIGPGDIIDVEKMDAELGSNIDLSECLFIGGETPLVGTPLLEGAKATAKVIRHAKDRKILVARKQPGKWFKKNGHRQQYTSLLIISLSDGKGAEVSIDKESDRAKKYLS